MDVMDKLLVYLGWDTQPPKDTTEIGPDNVEAHPVFLNAKHTMHKSCHCRQCNRGRSKYDRKKNERKLRQLWRTKGIAGPISSPYTD